MSNAVLRHGADGIDRLWLWCPGCEDLHDSRIGEWTWDGNVVRPTIGPSILVRYDFTEASGLTSCVCHSFVVDGVWQFLGDCTNALANQHVPMPTVEPQWPDWLDTSEESA